MYVKRVRNVCIGTYEAPERLVLRHIVPSIHMTCVPSSNQGWEEIRSREPRDLRSLGLLPGRSDGAMFKSCWLREYIVCCDQLPLTLSLIKPKLISVQL